MYLVQEFLLIYKISFYPLLVVLLVWQKGGHVVHNFDAPPIRIDRVQASQIVNCVQAALVLVEALQANFIAKNLQEFVEQSRVLVVVQYFFLRPLVLLNVEHTDFKLRLYEHLIQLEQFILGIWQLTQC